MYVSLNFQTKSSTNKAKYARLSMENSKQEHRSNIISKAVASILSLYPQGDTKTTGKT